MRKIVLGFLLVALCLSVSPVVAATYKYQIPVTVTENGTTNYPNGIALSFSINNTNLQTLLYLNSSANDTDFTTSYHLPVSDRVTFFLPSLTQSSTNIYQYYLGSDTQLSTFPIITGYNGNVTVVDAPNLELGNNFSLSQTGWIDTTAGANKYLFNKPEAIVTNITGAGNITSTVYNSLLPYANNQSGGGIAWDSPSAAYDANLATVAGVSINNNVSQWLQVSGNFSHNTTSVWWYPNGGGVFTLNSFDAFYNGSWNVLSTGGIVPTGWTSYALGGSYNVTAIRVQVSYGSTAVCTIAEIRFSHPSSNSTVTATGIVSGNHTVTTNLSSDNLSIFVDGVLKDSASFNGSSVLNNANNITLMAGNSMSYATNITLSINGTTQLYYAPTSIITSSILPNRTSSANNGTINWGTNPSNISVSLGSLQLLTSSTVSTNPTGGSHILPTLNPTPGQTYETSTGSSVAGWYELVSFLNTTTSIDIVVLWYILGFVLAILSGLALIVVVGIVAGPYLPIQFIFGAGLVVIEVVLSIFAYSYGVMDKLVPLIGGVVSFGLFLAFQKLTTGGRESYQ